MNSPAKGSGLLRFCSVPNLWSQVKPKLVPSNSTHFVIPWFYLRKQGGTPGREPWCETDAAENPTFRLHTFWGTQRITSQPKQLKWPEWAPRVHPPASCCSERIQCGCSQGLCCEKLQKPPSLCRHFLERVSTYNTVIQLYLNQLGKTKIKEWHYSITFTTIFG